MTTVDVVTKTQTIEVNTAVQTINVNPVTGVAIVVPPASPGVRIVSAGPVGPPGFAAGYNHIQSTVSDFWLINHNLGYRPSIQTFNAGGLEVLGEAQHVSNNQITVSFNSPISGSARLT